MSISYLDRRQLDRDQYQTRRVNVIKVLNVINSNAVYNPDLEKHVYISI